MRRGETKYINLLEELGDALYNTILILEGEKCGVLPILGSLKHRDLEDSIKDIKEFNKFKLMLNEKKLKALKKRCK